MARVCTVLIASATADNLQFSQLVFLHQQILFRRGGAMRPSPRGGCSTSHGCYDLVALAPSRRSTFFSEGLTASLRHSDHAWKGMCGSSDSSEPPGTTDAVASETLSTLVEKLTSRTRIFFFRACTWALRGFRRGTPIVSSDCCHGSHTLVSPAGFVS